VGADEAVRQPHRRHYVCGNERSTTPIETLTFGPEELRAYEAGFKSDFDVGDAPAR